MARILRDLRIILQSERLIARRQFEVIRAQTGLLALAGAVAAIGIVMLNVAGFYALREPIGGAAAALMVGVVDFLLAGVLVAIALRINAERETETAAQVRDMAIADLESEAHEATREVALVGAQVAAFAKDPGAMVMGKVVQLLIAFLSRKSG